MLQVDVGVYARYFQSVGIVFTTILLLTSILSQSFSVYGNIWLAEWSADAESGSPHVRDMYLGVYGGLGILQGVNITFLCINQIALKYFIDPVPQRLSRLSCTLY